MPTLSETLSEDLQGIAWMIEQNHPELNRKQLAWRAKRALARENRFSRTKNRQSAEIVDVMESDDVSPIGMIIKRETIDSALASCRAVSADLLDCGLALLADGGNCREGKFPTSRAALAAGIPERTAILRWQSMQARCQSIGR